MFVAISQAELRFAKPAGIKHSSQNQSQSLKLQGIFPGKLNDGRYDLVVKIFNDENFSELILEKEYSGVEIKDGGYEIVLDGEQTEFVPGKSYWLKIGINGQENLETEAQLEILPRQKILVENNNSLPDEGPWINGRYNIAGSYPAPDYVVKITNLANGYGLWAKSTGGTAVFAQTQGSGIGVYAENLSGTALYAKGATSLQGNTNITGDISVSGQVTMPNLSIPANSIGTSEIVNGSIAQSDLGLSSVGTSQIQDSSIVNADISPMAAIIASKIDRTGLDADLLDGKNSTDFIAASGNGTLQGNLNVAGTVQTQGFKLTTGGTNGYILTSDASGAGTWQPAPGGGGGGDITGVTAGSGLTGGGLSGDVTLSVGTGSISSSMITNGTIAQEDVTNGYIDLSSNQEVYGEKTFRSNAIFNGQQTPQAVFILTGNAGALSTYNASADYASILAHNGIGSTSDWRFGTIYAETPSSAHYGIGTNGKGYFGGGLCMGNDCRTVWPGGGGGGIGGSGTANYISKFSGATTIGDSVIYENNGNVGIGTMSPAQKLDVVGKIKGTELCIGADCRAVWPAGGGGGIGGSGTANYIPKFTGATTIGNSIIFDNGNVGIGTTNPQSKLAVNGKITAKEVVVTLTGWSDYVFGKNYPLVPLEDLEKQIQELGHLPRIPSALEVEKEGVNIGTTQARLLEKIEELTLYVIDLQKQIKELKQK